MSRRGVCVVRWREGRARSLARSSPPGGRGLPIRGTGGLASIRSGGLATIRSWGLATIRAGGLATSRSGGLATFRAGGLATSGTGGLARLTCEGLKFGVRPGGIWHVGLGPGEGQYELDSPSSS